MTTAQETATHESSLLSPAMLPAEITTRASAMTAKLRAERARHLRDAISNVIARDNPAAVAQAMQGVVEGLMVQAYEIGGDECEDKVRWEEVLGLVEAFKCDLETMEENAE